VALNGLKTARENPWFPFAGKKIPPKGEKRKYLNGILLVYNTIETGIPFGLL
jgi:hypothetical protein